MFVDVCLMVGLEAEEPWPTQIIALLLRVLRIRLLWGLVAPAAQMAFSVLLAGRVIFAALLLLG